MESLASWGCQHLYLLSYRPNTLPGTYFGVLLISHCLRGISGGSPGILCSWSWGQLYENEAARHSYGHMMCRASPHAYPLLPHWTSFTSTSSKIHLLRILRWLQQSVNQAQDPLHIHAISRDMCWLSFYICGIKGVRQNDLQCTF